MGRGYRYLFGNWRGVVVGAMTHKNAEEQWMLFRLCEGSWLWCAVAMSIRVAFFRHWNGRMVREVFMQMPELGNGAILGFV